jgi:Family of unknown function (DUF6600)
MKKLILIVAIVFISSFSFVKAQPYDNFGTSYGLFYNELTPYGSWIQINDGVVVWKPNVPDPGWAPYTDGRWVWTANGWYWDSYEPFGYIVYHYGRWYNDNYYGWIWVPDDQWAPAWVEWRYDNNYIGWAPLPPYAGFSIGAGIDFSINYVSPYRFWRFVAFNHFCDPYVYHYYIPSRNVYRIYNKTVYRADYGFDNGRVVDRGVDINIIRNRSGQRITETKIRALSNPQDFRSNGRANGNEVRAFVATREELSQNPSRNVMIRRGNERSTLDINKVRVDRTQQIPRVIGHDENNYRNVPESRTRKEVTRTESIDRERVDNNMVPQNESPIIIRKSTNNPPSQERVRKFNNNRRNEVQRQHVQKSPRPEKQGRDNSWHDNGTERPNRNR